MSDRKGMSLTQGPYKGEYLLCMGEEDLRSLLEMIKGAGLCERRHWNGIKMQIEKKLNEK